MRHYFTLVSWSDRQQGWCIEFGDYDKECVQAELEDMRASDEGLPTFKYRIVRTVTDKQDDIVRAVAELGPLR